MLTLLLGTDWTENRSEIMRMISQDISEEKDGRVLVVPELISHDTERRLCAAAGDTASRFAEVLPFTRLARRVAEAVGPAAQECLDNGGRVVAMASAVRQLRSKLKAYASVETKPEFLTGLVDAVDEFKRCCITPKDLMTAASKTEGSFAQKLEELALIFETYDTLCQQGKKDPRDQMTWLLEELECSSFGQEHVFYIDGFPDFNRQHMAIIEHLIRTSANVTVSLTCDKPNSTALAFERTGDTAADLIRCANRWGIPVDIRQINPRNDRLSALRKHLFQGKVEHALPDGILQTYRTETLYQECVSAAEKIMELVRSGARYRDISVVCADPASYAGTLEMVFTRCHIPVYMSGTENILDKTVVATVLAAMDTALNDFEQQDVLNYLKSILSPLELDICDKLENYAVLWSISGNRWLKQWENHPKGLGEQWTQEANTALAQLNEARALAMEPLAVLRKQFQQAGNLSQQVQALYGFFDSLCLRSRLDKLAQELDARGDNRKAQILNQLWEILLTALEQLDDMLGQTAWDTETFTRLFRLLLSQYDVGTIPHVLDSVTVGPVSAMRCQQSKHLIVLGALEGSLPSYGGYSGVLTDQERSVLREMGVLLTDGAMDGVQAEFAAIYGVFCGAENSVTVSCPGGQPSFLYRRLCELAGGEGKASFALGAALADEMEASAYLVRWNGREQAQALGIEEPYKQINMRCEHELGTVTRENIKKLYGEKLLLSASQVDTQAQCRLAYFLKYGLRAKERRAASVDPAEFGTYVHAVLESTARQIKQRGGFHSVSVEETLDIARASSDQYVQEHFSEFDTQRLMYLFRRNAQELEMIVRELWSELHDCGFEPVDFETAFGDAGTLSAIEIPSHSLSAQLRGYVDRVDVWKNAEQNYFRVVDYKTGKKDFDYCDIFNGLGLQMLLYMFALEQEGAELLGSEPIPAGVLYFPARVPVVSADGILTDDEANSAREKVWRRRGLLLSEEPVLEAMESDDAPNRMPYARKKDGSISGDLADKTQLQMLKTYVFSLLGEMVDEIAAGCIAPNPYTRGSSHNACAYCPYSAVCHKTTVEGRRNYKAMSSQEFWDAVSKEVGSHG